MHEQIVIAGSVLPLSQTRVAASWPEPHSLARFVHGADPL